MLVPNLFTKKKMSFYIGIMGALWFYGNIDHMDSEFLTRAFSFRPFAWATNPSYQYKNITKRVNPDLLISCTY